MGRLSGFRYRNIVKKLRSLGFAFDRQAAGSHEIWYNAGTDRYTSRRYAGRDIAGNTAASWHRTGRILRDSAITNIPHLTTLSFPRVFGGNPCFKAGCPTE